MKNKKLFTLLGSISLILVLAALPFLAACAQPAPAPPPPTPAPTPTPTPTPPAEPIVLKAISFLPESAATMFTYKEYIKRVNEAAKGELIIDYIGGPEVVSIFDQIEAVRTGVVDASWMATGLYTGLLPEAETFKFSRISLEEQRETGFYDYMVERHKTINVRFIGRQTYNTHFYFFTNIKVDRPQELKGQKMATASKTLQVFMAALGITPMTVKMGDRYTALERGLIDGSCESSDITTRGLHEVIKYMIIHPILCSDALSIMNLDKFNSLPPHLQKLLLDVQRDFEPWMNERCGEIEQTNIQKSKDGGVEFIEFTKEDAEWYVDLAYQAGWDHVEEVLPGTEAKVRPMLEKK